MNPEWRMGLRRGRTMRLRNSLQRDDYRYCCEDDAAGVNAGGDAEVVAVDEAASDAGGKVLLAWEASAAWARSLQLRWRMRRMSPSGRTAVAGRGGGMRRRLASVRMSRQVLESSARRH